MQNKIFYLLAILGLLFSPFKVNAADTPNMSFGIGGGGFEAENDDFAAHIEEGFGKTQLNFLFTKWLEAGIGVMLQSNFVTGDLGMRARINITEDQVLVPFAGGGIDMYWVSGDLTIEGDKIHRQGGYHWECGLQILLDYFDPMQAKEIQKKWGVENSYLSLGYRRAEIDDFGKAEVNIGGDIFFGEILVEF